MNKIEKFPIYDNTYMLLKLLDKKDSEALSWIILQYVFEDKIPTNLNENSSYVWTNIEKVLASVKAQILNGKKGGRPSKEKANSKPNEEPNLKPNPKPSSKAKIKPNYILNFIFIISNYKFINNNNLLKDKVLEWLNYKFERNENYKETGLTNLLKRIDNNAKKYGTDIIVDLISDSMSNNYKGIIWEKLKKQDNKEIKPGWFDKEPERKEATAEEIEEINQLLSKYK